MTAPSTRAAGLTSRDVEERVADGRVNRLPPRSGRTTWDIVRANTATRINALLGVLLVLALSTGSLINSLFGLAILANAGIGIVQELRAKRTLDALAIVGRAPVRVRRDGAVTEVDQADVVVDDVVELGAGDQVVVDGPVVESASLEVDESLLTGEADPVVKRPGDRLLSGSFVVAGSGAYRATDVGPAAYAARLAHEASAFTLVRSELRSGIDSILRVITWLLVPAGVLTVVNQLVISRQGFRQSVLGMVAALVPMVPEGLVLLTSVAFAIGVVRLGRRRCLVQELPAIEGLARVDVVCADKTGTLTENGMRLARVDVLDGPRDEVERALAALAALDPRPNASVAAVAEAFPDAPAWRATAVVPFSSSAKWSGMSFADADGPQGSWVLGAADVLLDPRSAVAQQATALGADGLRVLLLASTDAPVDAAAPDGGAPGHLAPRALVALEQRVRADARQTLDYFDAQGVTVKVVSGDNPVSVAAVARSLGLGGPETSVDARTLPVDRAELATVVEGATTFGRVRPDQKRAVVGALQARGHTVAMTGDGVNDVLALKDADIGVAMGSGSPAARSVAQIVLLDDRFATLPSVVGEGRRVIGNIERVAHLFLTKTVYAVVLAVLVGLAGVGAWLLGAAPVSYPFLPIHVTVAAWFTIGVPAFVMSLAPNDERARPGFVPRVLRLAVPAGVSIGVMTFLCYLVVDPGAGGASLGGPTDTLAPAEVRASTAALVTLLVGALWVLAVVARPYTGWKVLLVGSCAVFYVALFSVPAARELLSLDVSDPATLGVGLACGALAILLTEALRWSTARVPRARAAG